MHSWSEGHPAPEESRSTPALTYPRSGLREPGAIRYLRRRDASTAGASPMLVLRPARAGTASPSASERRRLERDLHDGVQTELIALMVKLALARQDPRTPAALADMLSGLEACAQAALDSVRDIARGIYPPLLDEFGVTEALRAQARRSPIQVSVVGTASRSTEQAEEAVYFSCSEAIQNAAKHAGSTATVKVWLHQHHGRLMVRIADDGRGFDPAHTEEGAGLQHIRERIEDLAGIINIASKPGRGTALTISLPWPARPRRG